MHQKIGELNGVWAILLRIALVAVLPWGVWVTANIFEARSFMAQGDRWTDKQALEQKLEIIKLIDEHVRHMDMRMDGLPPEAFVKRVDKIEDLIQGIQKDITDIKVILAKEKD